MKPKCFPLKKVEEDVLTYLGLIQCVALLAASFGVGWIKKGDSDLPKPPEKKKKKKKKKPD